MSGASIGIMDPAYFVGRKEILTWINTTFDLNIAKIEDTASGAVACQVFDAIYPGEVPMSKVKWNAKSDFEFIHNYKILQRVFDKKNIEKHIEVQKLIRAKYQDNLEFMQWTKSFYDKNCTSADYDPVARRAAGKGGSSFGTAAGSAAANRKAAAAPAPAPAAGRGARTTGVKPGARPAAAARRPGATKAVAAPGDSAKAERLEGQVADLKLSVEGLEKERDFYFGKLRDIEILLQATESTDLTKQIFTILYATEDDFVVVDDPEGEGEEAVADKENEEVPVAADA